MNEYVPQGMVQKQYHWEWVNYFLYRHLQENNPFPKLKAPLNDLLNKQEQQLDALRKLAASLGISSPSATVNIRYSPLLDCIKELHQREYELLQEYISYHEYFLPVSSYPLGIEDLMKSQLAQVNTLTELKAAFGQLFKPQHEAQKPDYILEKGYRLTRIATGLTFPTVMTFDPQGAVYVAEAGFAYGTEPGMGRVLRLESDGSFTEIASGFGGPVTGIAWHNGNLYVAAGNLGEKPADGCGEIIRLSPDGTRKTIVSGLRTCGDHFTGDILFGPDGKLYFSVGTATNSAVVGLDNMLILKHHPHFHDVPARDLELIGTNFITRDPLSDQPGAAVTGAYHAFGVPSKAGDIVQGRLLANGVIYCCNPDGSHLQIVADGFRNTFGLRFSPMNGKLIVTDHGADPRGSRQIRLDWDKIWEVTPGGWYGFPELFSGLPVTLPHFHAAEQAKPAFLIRNHPPLTAQPLARLQPHSASMKFDICANADFGSPGELYVAQFGESGFEKTEELPGFKVVKVNLDTGQISNFLTNPLGESTKQGPIRPIDVKFNAEGNELYLVDFGLMGKHNPTPGTGSLWKIVKI
ncbi:PQQ-dependent sugar dehydrogenase [Paenibacillus cellulositrophicus]|uniref:PQQ-dependent sugar dehydrogenase n=1 Tax=Paenibacillus cellulositrophicus TaxID=562959 RepID=UPI00203EEEB8|nr:PQQ-dependent sugar dehydrogenase [Paenibacillus cellulositrophicus]MCM3001674.1 PQQ-dependent sugar dehydrogenase [Paenibacillus cellulositrophicus]